MKNRNPPKSPQRFRDAANQKRTEERISQYYGKIALLNTWEAQPEEIQIRHHDYLLELRKTVRQVKMYVLHRAGPDAEI